MAFSDSDRLAEMEGRAVEGDNLPVESVPSNEGFWLGCAEGRVWVQLTGVGESPERVRPGQRLAIKGTVVSHPQDFAASIGVDQSEGAAEIDQQGVHLEVEYNAIRRR